MIKKSYNSFKYVGNGLKSVWKEQCYFKLEVFCAIVVIAVLIYFQASFEEVSFCVIAITMVLATEIINTAIEELCNKIEPNQHPHIGKIKDISVTFVFMAIVGALAIGVLVFVHHFF